MDAELKPQDFLVPTLGPATVPSPLGLSSIEGDGLGDFVPDEARVLYQIEAQPGRPHRGDLTMEKAGPREKIFFEPGQCKAAIVTCGGLCPGLNNVIRSIFLQLHHRYGVPTVLGIRYGYQGLNPAKGPPPLLPHARIRGADPQSGRHGAAVVAGAGRTGGDRRLSPEQRHQPAVLHRRRRHAARHA